MSRKCIAPSRITSAAAEPSRAFRDLDRVVTATIQPCRTASGRDEATE